MMEGRPIVVVLRSVVFRLAAVAVNRLPMAALAPDTTQWQWLGVFGLCLCLPC